MVSLRMRTLAAVLVVGPIGAACTALFSVDSVTYEGAVEAGRPDVDGTSEGARSDDALQPIDLNRGLVAYWKLDDDGNDSTDGGSNLGALLVANPVQYEAGKLGGGFFPGPAAGNNCSACQTLFAPPSSALEVLGDFTVSLWAVYQHSDNPWHHYGLLENNQISLLAAEVDAAGPAYPTLQLQSSDGGFYFVRDTSFDFRAREAVWTHLVAYRRGMTLGLWVNGRETASQPLPAGAALGDAGRFLLGGLVSGYPWQGVVDEVGKWNRALTPEEMSVLYNDGGGRTLP